VLEYLVDRIGIVVLVIVVIVVVFVVVEGADCPKQHVVASIAVAFANQNTITRKNKCCHFK
jgi:hypothetical protein